jgi:hypothetical protein
MRVGVCRLWRRLRGRALPLRFVTRPAGAEGSSKLCHPIRMAFLKVTALDFVIPTGAERRDLQFLPSTLRLNQPKKGSSLQ